jgi:hypothetical protein
MRLAVAPNILEKSLIHRFTCKFRQFRRNMEAARRECALHGLIAQHSGTWTSAQWKRQIRYANRLYRLSYGASPWRPYNGF